MELEQLYVQIEEVLGKPIERFYGAGKTARVNIDQSVGPKSFPQGDMIVIPPARPGPVPLSELPNGIDGMEYLLELGHIRYATLDDYHIWERRHTESLKSGSLAPAAMPRTARNRSFVAQTKIVVPDKLQGSDTFFLFVPKDVPEPEYSSRYNSYYFEKNGTCKGKCRRPG